MPRPILKYLYRSPIARDHQVRPAIAIQIGPHGSAHQADFLEDLVQNELSATETIHTRGRSFRITSGNDAAADKKVQITVNIEVAEGEWPSAVICL